MKWLEAINDLADSVQAIAPGTAPFIQGGKALVQLVDNVIDLPGIGDDEVKALEARRPEFEAMVIAGIDKTADRLKG